MVEVDPQTRLIGADGPVPLIDIFDGRSQLIAYFQMWHTGRPAAEQCESCTFSTSHINELSYLHSRDVSYATFCQGPYERARGIATSWAGRFPGTRCRGTPWAGWSQIGTSASWSVISETMTRSSRPTGPPAAATK